MQNNNVYMCANYGMKNIRLLGLLLPSKILPHARLLAGHNLGLLQELAKSVNTPTMLDHKRVNL